MAGAAVTAIKSDGTSAGTTTTATDGTYTLLLPKNGTYAIKITSGKVVMKAVYTIGTADATINVNPGTTAAVVILEKKLSTTFDSGTAFDTAVNGVDVNATVTAIAATSGFTTTATAVAAAVAANTNPFTDTAVTSAATTAAASVSTISMLVGTWVGSWANDTAHTDTFTFTSNTVTSINSVSSNCTETLSYTTNAGNITLTITAYSDATICNNVDGPVGTVNTGTYSISGNTLTMVLTISGTAYTYTGTKLSSTSTIVRYRTDAPWVAYQIGTGAWTAATSTDTGAVKTYTFDVGSSGKFGVANVCTGTMTGTRIWQFTRAEAWDRTQMCSSLQISVAGTVTGLTGSNQAVVFIGGKWGTSAWGIANSGAFSVGVHLPGTYDIVAIEYDPVTGTNSKILFQRDVVIGAATSGITFNFASGVAMVSRTVAVTGATGTNNAWGDVEVQTKNGTWASYSFNPNGSAMLPPASAMVAGEVFGLYAGYDVSATTMANVGKVLDATVDPGNATTLDPSTVTPISGVTVSAGVHPTISGLSYTKSAASPTFDDFWLRLAGATNTFTIQVTPAWLGTATTYTVPDFTGIGTWSAAWNLSTGVNAFEADAEGMSNPYQLNWTTGGNDSLGDSWFSAIMTSSVTLKPTLYGPRVSMRRD